MSLNCVFSTDNIVSASSRLSTWLRKIDAAFKKSLKLRGLKPTSNAPFSICKLVVEYPFYSNNSYMNGAAKKKD